MRISDILSLLLRKKTLVTAQKFFTEKGTISRYWLLPACHLLIQFLFLS